MTAPARPAGVGAGVAPGTGGPPQVTEPPFYRWLPFASAVMFVVLVLVAADTPILDIARYAGYATLAVALPGTLVYRALRARPHTLVEDVAMGVAVGLVLELAGWAVFSALDLRQWLWLWPLAVLVPFALAPGLRRHWWVRGYTPVPVGWAWAVAGVVAFFTTYLSAVFLERNPVLPTGEDTRQYLDLAYQLSLAGEAKHHLPLDYPQVAGEPLRYHWFGYAHMAASSLVGRLDLTVVSLRFTVPALCAAAAVLTAVVGWRASGRPYVGVGAAALLFVIGEVNFTHPVTMPFGTQATFVVWHGMSMTYSWVLLVALIGVLADLVARCRPKARGTAGDPRAGATAGGVPGLGAGAYPLAALLLLASGGAKASSLPVVAVALAFTALVLPVLCRRLPWPVIAAGVLAGVAQLFAMAVLFAFQSHALTVDPLWGLAHFAAAPPGREAWQQWGVWAMVVAAFLVNMQLRVAGVVPLLWLRRARLEPVQWFLLGGALAGPALYLVLGHPAGGNQYFLRAGFTFGVLLSAWGFALVLDHARLTGAGRRALGWFAVAFAAVLVAAQLRYADPTPFGWGYRPLVPILHWSAALVLAGVVASAVWVVASRRWPALRGRGGALLLTAVLVAGAPGLVMDMHKSRQAPNGGAYFPIPLPRSRVEAARWVRGHSRPDDVLATNARCLSPPPQPGCFAASFWLSAYAERRVLVEGWMFAPRVVGVSPLTFWDPDLLRRNDEAFTAPTAQGLAGLRDRHGVRWLVVDRAYGAESPELAGLAEVRFDNGRLAVYALG
ncbi:MAG TPA: hypothetical protein VFM54_15080 [Micromonosporaceae bacterium]|nr:hypothetical protein [Micromonosporaceae bacterium]